MILKLHKPTKMANLAQFVQIVHLTTQLRRLRCDHYSTRHVSVHKKTIIRVMMMVPLWTETCRVE